MIRKRLLLAVVLAISAAPCEVYAAEEEESPEMAAAREAARKYKERKVKLQNVQDTIREERRKENDATPFKTQIIEDGRVLETKHYDEDGNEITAEEAAIRQKKKDEQRNKEAEESKETEDTAAAEEEPTEGGSDEL